MWHKCKEELPKDNGMFLVTVYGSDMVFMRPHETMTEAVERTWRDVRYVTTAGFEADAEDGEQWLNDCGYPMNPQPVAWMEYPNPWEP